MKKTILSLVGTAALLSILSSNPALSEGAKGAGRKEGVERGKRRGLFTELAPGQKSELEECMAKELAEVLSKNPEYIISEFKQGKTVDAIIEESGYTLLSVQEKISLLHKEKIRKKLESREESDPSLLSKIEEMKKKVV